MSRPRFAILVSCIIGQKIHHGTRAPLGLAILAYNIAVTFAHFTALSEVRPHQL